MPMFDVEIYLVATNCRAQTMAMVLGEKKEISLKRRKTPPTSNATKQLNMQVAKDSSYLEFSLCKRRETPPPPKKSSLMKRSKIKIQILAIPLSCKEDHN
jgi:hypothetical protein